MPVDGFSLDEKRVLLDLARDSIQHGLEHGGAIPVNAETFKPSLALPGAAFVTLEKRGELRGCIGSIEAHRPLVEDIAINAWNAAFRDPRFSPIRVAELDDLQIDISILTAPEAMSVSSEADLKQQLIPHRDGLIISEGYYRGLFLPAVWEKLPDVDSFLSHLKQKAGFPVGYWSRKILCQRFYSIEFGEGDH